MKRLLFPILALILVLALTLTLPLTTLAAAGITANYSAATHTITVDMTGMTKDTNYYLDYYSPASSTVPEATHGPFINSTNNWGTTDTLTLVPTQSGGTWTIKLRQEATLKQTKTVDVKETLLTADSSYTTEQTTFAPGDTVYVKGIGYDPNHGNGAEKGKWYLKFFDPSNTLMYTSAWILCTANGDITGNGTLPSDAALGIWTIKAYCAEHDNLHGSTTFTVEPGTEIVGQTHEVNCDILTGVNVTLYQDAVAIASTISDGTGNYTLAVAALGDYNVTASKAGFRDETQAITVAATITYTLDFVGDHGLVPNAPDMSYVLACINLWKYGTPPCALTLSKVLAVINAWKNPIV